jgi:SAM-dependent methyltransferase
MRETLEGAVARHYGVADLASRILDALKASGLDPLRLRPEDLAPVDEFHIGGRAATEHAVAKMGLAADRRVLDVGCGLGGATRYLAATLGCRVTGIDLTPDYIAAARMLAERTGLAGRVDYRVASALDMPFEDRSFDAAITFHVAMNIADRAGLYREVARVLRPGAVFCIYDVMKGPQDGLEFPVPWAETAETSHLATPAEMRSHLSGAGFEVAEVDDRTAYGIEFFRQRLAPGQGPPSPLGLHLLMGANAREKFQNVLRNLEAGRILAVVMIARKR